MAESADAGSRFRFGVFELDLQAGELRKRGIRVRLQEQPLQILGLLVESPGEVVTREQIQKKLWCDDTFVDFDNAINGAVRKMRDALGDNSENPRFVETVARRGYRFIAPVTLPLAQEIPAPPGNPTKPEIPVQSRTRLYELGGLCVVSLLAGAGIVHWLNRAYTEQPTIETLTYSGRDSSPSMSPDGKTVAFSSDRDGTPRIWIKQLKGGGEAALTSGPDGWPRFSPDGATILFSRREGPSRYLYKVASVGGEPRRVIDDALDGDFSPDGRHIAFVTWKFENQHLISSIGISSADGSGKAQLAEVRDVRLEQPRWSRDGSSIAMTGAPGGVSGEIFDQVWVVRMDDKRLRPLTAILPSRGLSSVAWQDSRTVLYTRGDRTEAVTAELIAHDTIRDTIQRRPWRCCSLTLDNVNPGGLIFDERATRSSLLELGLNDQSARWITHANSPDRVPVYSPDGKWIVFSSRRDGHMNLWQISRETGSVNRLTEDNSADGDPALSPDGKHLIFSSDRGGGYFAVYLANRDGSGVRQLTRSGADAENATMTPDGKWVVYASDNAANGGIWKIHPDGSNNTQIVRGPGSNAEVSPDGNYALYLVNPQPDLAEILVVRISDGVEVARRIQCWRRRQNGITLGRARWVPASDGKTALAIAFIDQDATGATGVSIQQFAAGRDTSATRKPLRPFDPIAPFETLGVSPDGKKIVVSVADDTSSIMWTAHIPRW